MIGHLSRLARLRELLWMLAMSELKTRHRQTVLGVLWTIAQPLSMMLVFTVMFSLFVKVPIQGASYAVFAYIGLLLYAALLITAACAVFQRRDF